MKLSIAEFTDAIDMMNTCLSKKQENLENLEKSIQAFIHDESLQWKSYQSAKDYFRDMHLPVVRGMILAYEEIRRANSSCLNDLYIQVSSDYTTKIDTDGLTYYLNEAKNTLNQLEELEKESPFAQNQRTNIQSLESQVNKVACFNMLHVGHYDTANTYMSYVRSALSQFRHRSFDTKTKIYKYTVKNKTVSFKINKNWKEYQKNKIEEYLLEDGRVDYKKLNADFWNREDGFFQGNWWQDPEKLAKAAYVLKLEARTFGEINIVDMISQYKEGEHNPRLNTLQALANAPRQSSYDISLIDAITTNLYACGRKFDESKGTLDAQDIEALAKREKNIKFRKLGNWLENGGMMLVDGITIIAVAGAFCRMGGNTGKVLDESASSNVRKFKIGEAPKIKSSSYSKSLAKTPSEIAESWQGDYPYVGVDKYRNITLKKGKIIYIGEPYPTGYATTKSAVARINGNSRKLFEGLQVKPYWEDGMNVAEYRSKMMAYKITKNTNVAFGITKANPQFGKGGLPQIFIPDFKQLVKNGTIMKIESKAIELNNYKMSLDDYNKMLDVLEGLK